MNVKELKSLAKDLGIKGYSTLKKADLEAVTSSHMESLHSEALKMNDMYDHARGLDERAEKVEVNVGTPFFVRVHNYHAQNGYRGLTQRQARRAYKKWKHHLGKGYKLDTVMGRCSCFA